MSRVALSKVEALQELKERKEELVTLLGEKDLNTALKEKISIVLQNMEPYKAEVASYKDLCLCLEILHKIDKGARGEPTETIEVIFSEPSFHANQMGIHSPQQSEKTARRS